MKIIDNRKTTPKPKLPQLSVGDWIELITKDGVSYVCLIAQTSGGAAKLIHIGTGKKGSIANRYDDTEFSLNGYELEDSLEDYLYKDGIELINRLNVTITIDHV